MLVVAEAAGVAPQFVDDPLVRRSSVIAAAGDVDVLVIVHHPDVAALGRGLTEVGRDLDQSAERRFALIDILVEHAVELERRRELDRADRGLALRVARDDGGGDRRRGTVNDDRTLRASAGRG